jgi:hypothetical protein
MFRRWVSTVFWLRNSELASGQRLERRSGRAARRRAVLDSMAELAKLPLRLAAVAEGAGLPEVVGRAPKLGCGAVTVARKHPTSGSMEGRPPDLARPAARGGEPPACAW